MQKNCLSNFNYLNNAIELDDDDTDDPAMEADSLVMAVQRPAADL